MPTKKASSLLESQRETSNCPVSFDHVDEHSSLQIDKARDIHSRVLDVRLQERRLVDPERVHFFDSSRVVDKG
jgi:hypothetical protein